MDTAIGPIDHRVEGLTFSQFGEADADRGCGDRCEKARATSLKRISAGASGEPTSVYRFPSPP